MAALPPIDGLPPALRGPAVLTVVIAVGMASLDTSIANAALPTIAFDLDATPVASIWVVNAYQLALVACLLPFASLGRSWATAGSTAGGWRRSPLPRWPAR